MSALHRYLGRPLFGAPVLALALAGFLAFGVVGFGTHLRCNLDMHFFYVAGKTWLLGLDPYQLGAYRMVAQSLPEIDDRVGMGFAYPPQIAPFCLLLAAMPLSGASLVMTLVNLVALGALVAGVLRIARTFSLDGTLEPSTKWVVPALILANPFTLYAFYAGQMSFVSAAAVTWAWCFASENERPVLSGVLMGIATVKPQIALLPIVWMLARRDPKQWLAFFVTLLVGMGFPLALVGPVDLAKHWILAARDYSHGPYQAPGLDHVFGVQSLLASAGAHVSGIAVLAVLATALLANRRERFNSAEILALLFGVAFLFVYSHDYDLTALAPLFAGLWVRSRRSTPAALVLSLSLAVFFVPQRLVRHRLLFMAANAEAPSPFLHWREIMLFAFAGWFVWVILRERRSNPHMETASA